MAMLNGQYAGLGHRRRGIEVRFTHAKVQHVLAVRLAPLGLGADGDGFGGLEMGEVLGERVGQANDARHGGKDNHLALCRPSASLRPRQ
jgi:hypothetical protein